MPFPPLTAHTIGHCLSFHPLPRLLNKAKKPKDRLVLTAAKGFFSAQMAVPPFIQKPLRFRIPKLRLKRLRSSSSWGESVNFELSRDLRYGNQSQQCLHYYCTALWILVIFLLKMCTAVIKCSHFLPGDLQHTLGRRITLLYSKSAKELVLPMALPRAELLSATNSATTPGIRQHLVNLLSPTCPPADFKLACQELHAVLLES